MVTEHAFSIHTPASSKEIGGGDGALPWFCAVFFRFAPAKRDQRITGSEEAICRSINMRS